MTRQSLRVRLLAIVLIAIVAIAAVQALGSAIVQLFQNIVSRLQGLGR